MPTLPLLAGDSPSEGEELPVVAHLRRSSVAACGVVLTLAGLTLGSPARAEPPAPVTPASAIAEVAARLDRLEHEGERAAERFNGVSLQIADAREALAAQQQATASLQRRHDALTGEVGLLARVTYQSVETDPVLHLLAGGAATDMLARLSRLEQVTRSRQATLAELEALATERRRAGEVLDSRLATLRALQAELTAERRRMDASTAAARRLLAGLQAQERARLKAAEEARQAAAVRAAQAARASAAAQAAAATRAAADSARASATAAQRSRSAEQAPAEQGAPPAGTPASAPATAVATAIQTALAQVGDAYVYAASGPAAFDCSGLTMYAYAAAGIELPHFSGAQAKLGVPVSRAELQPGDLVFFYSPISHVGLYLGDDQMVHAANPRKGVAVDPVDSMPFATAVRLAVAEPSTTR